MKRMPAKSKTVLIVGAGPAGCATAISLLQAAKDHKGSVFSDLKVILTDRAYSDDQGQEIPRQAIGETIPPAATPVIRRLGLMEQLENSGHIPCPGSWSLWGDDTPGFNDFFFNPEGRGYHLDRTAFDRDLVQRAMGLGVIWRPGMHLHETKETGNQFQLGFRPVDRQKTNKAPSTIDQFENTEQKQWIECDFLVDASGVSAAALRRLGIARNLIDEVISVGTFFDLPRPDTGKPAHTFVQATENGWWYGAKLPHQRATISFCSDNTYIKEQQIQHTGHWHTELQKAPWFLERCEEQFGCSMNEPDKLYVKPSPSAILSSVAGKNWLAVGDAASSYDSMSSAGITKALLHAEIAGKAIHEWLESADAQTVTPALNHYQQRVFDDFNAYLRLHQTMYRNKPYGNEGFWKRRQLGY